MPRQRAHESLVPELSEGVELRELLEAPREPPQQRGREGMEPFADLHCRNGEQRPRMVLQAGEAPQHAREVSGLQRTHLHTRRTMRSISASQSTSLQSAFSSRRIGARRRLLRHSRSLTLRKATGYMSQHECKAGGCLTYRGPCCNAVEEAGRAVSEDRVGPNQARRLLRP